MKKALVLSALSMIALAATTVRGQLKDPCFGLGIDCFQNRMKVTGYAPGPWVYDAKTGAINSGVGVSMDTDFESGFEVARVVKDWWVPKTIGANGRLIAASPTLYEFVVRRAKAGDKDAQKLLASLQR